MGDFLGVYKEKGERLNPKFRLIFWNIFEACFYKGLAEGHGMTVDV